MTSPGAGWCVFPLFSGRLFPGCFPTDCCLLFAGQVPARHALGALLAEKGKHDEAIVVYKEDLAVVPMPCYPHHTSPTSVFGLLRGFASCVALLAAVVRCSQSASLSKWLGLLACVKGPSEQLRSSHHGHCAWLFYAGGRAPGAGQPVGSLRPAR